MVVRWECLSLSLVLGLLGAVGCRTTSENLRGQHINRNPNPTGSPNSSPDPLQPSMGTSPGAGPVSGGSQVGVKPYEKGNSANVFADSVFFVDPGFVSNLSNSAALIQDANSRATIEAMKGWGGTGIWVDDRTAIALRLRPALEAARRQSKATGKSVVIPVVIYDLPNRDCNALASNGELLLDANGMNIYKTEYIDPIAALFKSYPDLRIAAIIEPDSLPNLVTALSSYNPNRSVTTCNATIFEGYKEGVSYALKQLSLPHVGLYIDAGHSGWLGYNAEDRRAFIDIVYEVAMRAGGLDRVRGLATNVANYSSLDQGPMSPSGEALEPALTIRTEHSYVDELAQIMKAKGFVDPHFIIDTGRNGEPRSRQVLGHWCNIARARIGQKPVSAPRSNVDAYVWVKAPGESDGSSVADLKPASPADALKKPDPTCKFIDPTNLDPLDVAPVAGKWFLPHFENLIRPAGSPPKHMGSVPAL